MGFLKCSCMAADVTEIEIMMGELLERERVQSGPSTSAQRVWMFSLLGDVARNYDGSWAERVGGFDTVGDPHPDRSRQNADWQFTDARG